jgi:hypothetical protein
VCLGIVVTVGAAYCADLTGAARITTDAEQYIGTARNLLAGRGLVSDVALGELHYRFGRLPFPLTDFPPGYPLLIAVFLAFGATGTAAVVWINFLSLFTSALLIYAILRTLEVRRSLRLAGAAFWLAFVPSWAEAFTGGSTLPFILATLLSHLFLLLW